MREELETKVLKELNLEGRWVEAGIVFAPHAPIPASTPRGEIKVTNIRPGIDLAHHILYDDGTLEVGKGNYESHYVVISDLSSVGLTVEDLDDFELEMLGL